MKINQFLLTGTVALIITSCSQNADDRRIGNGRGSNARA